MVMVYLVGEMWQ